MLNIEIVSSTQILSWNHINTNDREHSVSVNRILHVGGSGPGNYSRIQYAIDASNDGDTVFVWNVSSPYFENIMIDKQIFLIGENKNSTIIDGSGLGDVIIINTEGVTITGFTIKNSEKGWLNAGIILFSDKNYVYDNIIVNAENGIYSYDLDDTIIENNHISNCDNCGISIPFSSNNTIRYNTLLHCNNYGIFIYDSLYDTVTDNDISNSDVGIHLWYSFYNTISHNSVSNSNIGLRFCLYSKNNTVMNNVIKDSRDCGIDLNFSLWNHLNNNVIENANVGVTLYYSNGNVIENNNIITDGMIGFNITYSPDNIISGNRIQNNSYGMKFFSSANNTMEHNYIIGNDEIGILFTDGSNENRIHDNHFILNHKNAFFMNSMLNHWNQNYWDDWNGKGFYIINGKFYLSATIFSISWVNIDFSPRNEPY